MKSIIGFIFWLAVTFAAAMVGSRYMPGEWYQQIAKPSWTPPDGVFAPVWTLLYSMMAISAWLVWKSKGFFKAIIALLAYLIQLILNALWSYIFFGLHDIHGAFLDIVALWIFILITIFLFWKHNKLASVLLIPYFLWVSFASVLNLTVASMN